MCLSCHLVVPDAVPAREVLTSAYQLLGEEFGIDHATIQIEPQEFAELTPRAVCNDEAHGEQR